MKDSMRVSQFMTRTIIVGSLNSKISDIISFFTKNRIKHLPITSNDKLVGIISIKDILDLIQKKLDSNENITLESLDAQSKVQEIMTKNPVSVQPDTLISDALVLLQDGEFEALPVTEYGSIVGIITNKDLVKVFSMEQNPPHITYTIESPGYGI